MPIIAEARTLFEIDTELDALFDEIEAREENGETISEELLDRFWEFCNTQGEKIDRIGRFVRMMVSRGLHCRNEATRLTARARAPAHRADRVKSMVLYYLLSRELSKVKGSEFTLRVQKNSQDSVKVIDDAALPLACRRVAVRVNGVLWEKVLSNLPDGLAKALEVSIQETTPDTEAIKAAYLRKEQVPGAEVRRGSHLRIA